MSVSQNSGTVSTKAEKERIKLLKSLHRPLEEHWSDRKDVDAIGSDYTYKHHITRLDDIYLLYFSVLAMSENLFLFV